MLSHRQTIIEIYGWYGVAAVVAAYTLNSLGYLERTDLLYIALNITGGLGLLIDNLSHRAWQSMVANLIWIVVGIFSLMNIF